MNVRELNFFQKQYLTLFKNKLNKPKADIYQEIIRFVMESHYAPTFKDLLAVFPTREKTLVSDLRYMEQHQLIVKTKIATEFFFFPVLRPFVTMKESQEEVYTYFDESTTNHRGIELREKVNAILDARKKYHRDDFKSAFEEGGIKDDPRFAPKKTADDYDRGELPPNFDDAENSSGLVVV